MKNAHILHYFPFVHSRFGPPGPRLSVKSVEEDGDAEQEEGVGVDHVPPERGLSGVRQLLLQLRLLLRAQLNAIVLFQAAETQEGPFEQTRLFPFFFFFLFVSVVHPVVRFNVNPLLGAVPQTPAQTM